MQATSARQVLRTLVTGAGGLVGLPLAERCERMGLEVVRAGRRKRGDGWLAWNMSAAPPPFEGRLDCVLHAAPLWLLPDHVAALAAGGVGRIICFGSTSVLTKKRSASGAERTLAESLDRAETRIRNDSSRLGVATTIFRPTMIYGYGRDANVSAIAAFIRRYGFFPIAGGGAGRRQPVHAEDLVEAAVAALDKAETFAGTYDLAGGETMTYRQMVTRIFEALGKPVRLIRVPTSLFGLVLAAGGLIGKGTSAAMATRMNQDLVFDSSRARADFGFQPQAFLAHPERDLPAS